MAESFGVKMGVEGEKEFKNALKEELPDLYYFRSLIYKNLGDGEKSKADYEKTAGILPGRMRKLSSAAESLCLSDELSQAHGERSLL